MQPRLWLASAAAVTLVAGGVYVASPTVHGQAPKTPATDDRPKDVFDDDRLARDIEQAVEGALAQSGLRDGRLSADIQRAVDEATRTAQEVVRDLDVDVIVDDAMQDVELLGGRPRLGVSTRDLTADEAKAAGLAGIAGAFVTQVEPESPAGKAGLQANDVITTIDGETVRSVRHLSRLIGETPEGRALQVGYLRGTAKQTATILPESRPMARGFRWDGGDGPMMRRFERRLPTPESREFLFRRGPGDGRRIWVGNRARLGVMTQPVTDQLATYFGVKNGVLVTQVTENSPAAKAGIKAGDVITAVNGTPVTSAGDISRHLEGVEADKTVAVELTRDRKAQTITVTMAPPANTSDDRPVPRRMRFTA